MSQATSNATASTAKRDVPAHPEGTPAPTPARARSRSKLLRPILMLGGIVLVAAVSLGLWLNGGRYVSIDNAYVRAAKMSVSSDVSGIVMDVAVQEGMKVRKGDVLLRLNPAQFQNALDGAKANLAQVGLTLDAMKHDYRRMLRDIEVRQAQLANNTATLERTSKLVQTGAGTQANFDASRFAVQADQAAVEALRTQADVQLAKLGGNADAAVEDLPQFQQAKAQVAEAQRQLDHTILRAPFDGIVTLVDSVQPGMYLAAATAALGIISTERVWIDANPKESDITHVKVGNPVSITVDTYPGRRWKGSVCSISPSSGAEFAILPPQNSSGNWVKVVQRIPVRVCIERRADDPDLRSGMSTIVDIDTGHQRQWRDLIPQ
jgi:membrane fusion protein (multidrug efflux system)